LFALVFVSLSAAICVKVGYYFDTKLNRVKIKKHGYSVKSIFREGMDVLLETLKMGLKWGLPDGTTFGKRRLNFFVDAWKKCYPQ
jgi:hypothetical protein